MNICRHKTQGIQTAKKQKQIGLTAIELTVAIAIVSILATITLTAYSNFKTRSKVAKGLLLANDAKASVTSFYTVKNRFPRQNNEAGLPQPRSYDKSTYISRVEVNEAIENPSNGIITITLKVPALGTNNKLQLVPTAIGGGQLSWECMPATTNGVDPVQAPPNCQG